MTVVAILLAVILAIVLALLYVQEKRLVKSREEVANAQQAADQQVSQAQNEAQTAMAHAQKFVQQTTAEINAESARIRQHYEMESRKAQGEAQAAVVSAQKTLEQKIVEIDAKAEHIRQHYEAQARIAQEALNQQLAELEPLRAYASFQDAEVEVRQTINDAIAESSALRQEADSLLAQTRNAAAEDQIKAQWRAQQIYNQAEAVLSQATRDAGLILVEAEKRAQEIGGSAYTALKEKDQLENAVKAIRNVVDGYGDRYIIPTHSLLDNLATDFGHTTAGEALRVARLHSRRMVEQGQAALCDYAEASRRETAIRFVIDAFNGRVDAILSRVKHDNHGTLSQEIRDSFSLVNLNGQAFRNARIDQSYLDARLAELKWAVVTQELKAKEREEQRLIREQIREEEKARREYERVIQETAREEANLMQAMEKARLAVENATAQDRAKYEAQLSSLSQRLAEAEAKNQRALSMAQQTRSGHVYIISNIGTFGQDVFKIGMTRRLEPLDRVKELGDASVPFEFDVHAMIYSEDAPTLENQLHKRFNDLRLNKVNYRKEFFRVPLDELHSFATEQGMEVSFTMLAEARQYRETLALEKMTPEEREKYRLRRVDVDLFDE